MDCGWHREMSPNGVFDKKAQIKSLGSSILYQINQGVVEKGKAINEQLEEMGIKDTDIDYVLLTHLDCDHANGLKLVAGAKHIMVSQSELLFAQKKSPVNMIRYQRKWWNGVNITPFEWTGTEGPFQRSYDLFGDGSIVMVNIPGHSDGLCAVKIKNEEGKFVLLYSDGGYATKSWRDMITSGIAVDKKQQYTSLEWIRQQSMDKDCIESLANHDSEVVPHIIEL